MPFKRRYDLNEFLKLVLIIKLEIIGLVTMIHQLAVLKQYIFFYMVSYQNISVRRVLKA